MRRFRFDGGLGPVFRMPKVASSWRGSAWTRTAKAFKAVNLQCAKCGAIADLECDHIVPRDQGGSDDWSNLQSLCKACHAAKSAVERGKRPGRGGSGAWKNPIG
jgi:5-methylcytosine-specific restriction protein A